MKHTKKWLKITASTLALTDAIATPIALTSCSKTSPIQPIETNGQIEVAFIGDDLTKNLEPFQNIKIPLDDLFTFKNKETDQTYQANELNFELGDRSLQWNLKECFPISLSFETISENTNTYLTTTAANTLAALAPGNTISLPINQISLKSDPSIKADFNGGAYHLNFLIKDDLKEILPSNYDQFAWNLSVSLSSNTGFNYTNLPGTQATNGVHSDLSGNMTVQKSYLINSMYNGDINPNGFWGDYQVCPSITPSLISRTNPNELIRNSAENTTNGNVLNENSDRYLFMYLDPEATSSKLLEFLFPNHMIFAGNPDVSVSASCLQLLLSNDTSNASYANYYQGSQITIWVYLPDSSSLQTGIANPTHEQLFQKITVNFA